jgi:hypothetical protein
VADTAGSQSGRHRRPPDVWFYAVNAAESERAIVTAARDYLATWTPEEISRLPESCRPERITSGEDISDYAYRLSQARLAFCGPAADRALVDRMMGFFAHAAERVAALLAPRD